VTGCIMKLCMAVILIAIFAGLFWTIVSQWSTDALACAVGVVLTLPLTVWIIKEVLCERSSLPPSWP
jgi:hypothetical protein